MKPFLAVIDPPWNTESGGGGRGAQNHYALNTIDALIASYQRAAEFDPRSCVPLRPSLVWMWTTGSAILAGDAHSLARALGHRPCAEWVWAKVDTIAWESTSNPGPVLHQAPAKPGLGQWCRKEHEHLWLLRSGDVKVPPPASRPRSVIYAPRGKHSAKPEEAWRVIETVSRAVLPGVVGVEFNARTRRPGWHAIGALDGEDQPIRFEDAT